jgi:hypothetical protein
MKPRVGTAVLLFISAYAPLFLILAVKDFDFEKTHCFKHSWAVSVLLGLSTLSVALLWYTVHSIPAGNKKVTIKKVQTRSADLINYTIPYIVSFFAFDLSKVDDVISLSIFLLLLLLLTVRSKSVFMNPILLLFRYNLYDIEYEFDSKEQSTIALSKHELRVGQRYDIRMLTRYMYFVTQPEDQ